MSEETNYDCSGCKSLLKRIAKLQSENERLRELIEKYGTEPSKFDWGVLKTIDELETELEKKNEKIKALKMAIDVINKACNKFQETKE